MCDETSGYNALEDLPDDVEYNDIDGGSSNEPSPFSEDDDDTEFRTTENGVHFPLKDGETIKQSCKEHFEKRKKKRGTKLL